MTAGKKPASSPESSPKSAYSSQDARSSISPQEQIRAQLHQLALNAPPAAEHPVRIRDFATEHRVPSATQRQSGSPSTPATPRESSASSSLTTGRQSLAASSSKSKPLVLQTTGARSIWNRGPRSPITINGQSSSQGSSASLNRSSGSFTGRSSSTNEQSSSLGSSSSANGFNQLLSADTYKSSLIARANAEHAAAPTSYFPSQPSVQASSSGLSANADAFAPVDNRMAREELTPEQTPTRRPRQRESPVAGPSRLARTPSPTPVGTGPQGSVMEQPFSSDVPGGPTRYVSFEVDYYHLARENQTLNDAYDQIMDSAFANAIHHDDLAQPFMVQDNGRTLIFAFDSLNDAESAFTDPVVNTLGIRRYIDVNEYVLRVGNADRRNVVNRFEGQILVTISPTSAQQNRSRCQAYSCLLHWIDRSFGSSELRAMRVVQYTSTTVTYRIELDHRQMALSTANNHRNPRRYNNSGSEYLASVLEYRPETYHPQERRQRAHQSTQRLPALPHRPANSTNINVVDDGRIIRGEDVRTTVMIRNIPNQMTTYELQDLLQRFIPGRYDFVYLRIDFHAMSNVGYAFVNLETPMDIFTLHTALVRNGWGRADTRKTPALSYATVQGREALIEKFRNSSVMEEGDDCKPKLIISEVEARRRGGDAWAELVGREQPFPDPNNQAKLERSRQNAETQGLWQNQSRQRPGQPLHWFDNGNPNASAGPRGPAMPQLPAPIPAFPPPTLLPPAPIQPGLGSAMNAFNGVGNGFPHAAMAAFQYAQAPRPASHPFGPNTNFGPPFFGQTGPGAGSNPHVGHGAGTYGYPGAPVNHGLNQAGSGANTNQHFGHQPVAYGYPGTPMNNGYDHAIGSYAGPSGQTYPHTPEAQTHQGNAEYPPTPGQPRRPGRGINRSVRNTANYHFGPAFRRPGDRDDRGGLH